MTGKRFRACARSVLALALAFGASHRAAAAPPTSPYAVMAPVAAYMMPRDAEIALAASAAPTSISGNARILVLARSGYETAVEGKNGFVCLVERGWAAGFDEPEFWNPKIRGPLCLSPSAVRTYLPRSLMRARLALAGRTKDAIRAAMQGAIAKGELPELEPGAMSYMLSKNGYLHDDAGHWHPHLMFFMPATDPAAWGAGLAASPVIASADAPEHMTLFLVPVRKWSDGTFDTPMTH